MPQKQPFEGLSKVQIASQLRSAIALADFKSFSERIDSDIRTPFLYGAQCMDMTKGTVERIRNDPEGHNFGIALEVAKGERFSPRITPDMTTALLEPHEGEIYRVIRGLGQ